MRQFVPFSGVFSVQLATRAEEETLSKSHHELKKRPAPAEAGASLWDAAYS